MPRGKSLIEKMWGLLDDIMDKLMSNGSAGEMAHLKGRAYGIAECIALMTNPIHRDVEDVRSRAMERWEARQDGEAYAHPGDGRTIETGETIIAYTSRK